MTFIISLVVLVAMFVLMGFKVLEVSVAMTLVGTVVGYWIRDVQETLIPSSLPPPAVTTPTVTVSPSP